jgi:hypothetical protein
MVSPNKPTKQATDERVAFTARFPRPLYKTLRKHLIDREPTISINAFIVLAVKNQLAEEAVSLT